MQLAVFLPLFMHYALIADIAGWLYSYHYLCITPWLQTMQLAVFLPLFMHYALIADIAGWLYSCHYLCITPWLQTMQLAVFLPLFMHYALTADIAGWLYSCHYLCITLWLQTMQLAVFLPLFMHFALITDNTAGYILATIYALRPDYRQYSWLYSCHYLCITPRLQTIQLAVFLPLFMHYALITDNAAGCILATIYALRPDYRQYSWLYSCHYLCITPWLQTIQLPVFLPLFMHYALIADNAAGCILATIYALRSDYRHCRLAVFLPLFMHYALITDNTAGCILATIYALRPDCRLCSWLYSCHYLCITPWLQTMQLAVILTLSTLRKIVHHCTRTNNMVVRLNLSQRLTFFTKYK